MCSPFVFLAALSGLAPLRPGLVVRITSMDGGNQKMFARAVRPRRNPSRAHARSHRIHFPGRGEANTGGYE